MAITVFLGGKSTQKKSTHDHFKHIISERMSRLSLHFTRARVSIRDLNGPKGGVDKECMIRLDVPRSGSLTVKARARSASAAFSKAIEMIQTRVKRRVSKRPRVKEIFELSPLT
jgi:ribosome-associated translation inhibitor RaiA